MASLEKIAESLIDGKNLPARPKEKRIRSDIILNELYDFSKQEIKSLVNLLRKRKSLRAVRKENTPNTSIFLRRYIDLCSSVSLRDDSKKRNALTEILYQTASFSKTTRPLSIVLSNSLKLAPLKTETLIQWADSFRHIFNSSEDKLKNYAGCLSKDRAIERYSRISSRSLSQYHPSHSHVLEIFRTKSLFGLESFLFSLAKAGEMSRPKVSEAYKTLKKINSETRRTIGTIHSKYNSPEVDSRLYSFISLAGDKKNYSDILAFLSGAYSKLEKGMFIKTIESLSELAEIDNEFLQSNFSAVERARNTIGNAAVFAYLQTLRKIADIAGQKERREEYAKISLEFFKDYPKDYKTAQNMALAGIMEIDALPPAIRETSLRCIRYFCDKAEFTCRAAQNPRLYFLDAVSNIISANKKNPSEAQTFLKEILEYNPESSKSKYLGGQDEL